MTTYDWAHEDVAALIEEQWASQRPDVDTDAITPLLRIARIWALARDEAERACSVLGFGTGEMDLLLALRRWGPPYAMRPTELQKECLVTSGAITGRIDRLVALRLVDRLKSPEDGRSWLIHLTDHGFQTAEQLFERNNVDAIFPRAFRAMPASERRTLNRVLKQLHLSMERKADILS